MVKNTYLACLSSFWTTCLLSVFLLLTPFACYTQYFALGPEANGPRTERLARIHKVVKGETLYSISRMYNLSVRQLMNLNRLPSITIFIGQELVVGSLTDTATASSAVSRRSSPSSPNVRVSSIEEWAQQNTSEKEEISVPSYDRMGSDELAKRIPRNEYYKVKRGEDIYSIARQEAVLVEQLREWNAISEVNEGQTIVIRKWVEDLSGGEANTQSPAARYAAARLETSPQREDQNQYIPERSNYEDYRNEYRRRRGPVSISAYRRSQLRYQPAREETPEFIKASPPRLPFSRISALEKQNNETMSSANVPVQDLRNNYRKFENDPVPATAVERSPSSTTGFEKPVSEPKATHRLRYEYSDSEIENFEDPAPTTQKGEFIEIYSNQPQANRFYAAHKSLPIGSTFRLVIPGNGGHVEVKVVHRLPSDRQAMVGLSPACVSILKGAGERKQVTIMFE